MDSRGGGKFLDDAQSLKALVGQLPYPERAEYESYACRSMEVGFPNRYLVVYTLSGGRPEDIELWRFGDMTMDRINGPTISMEVPKVGQISVGVLPKKISGRDVYIHVPQSFEFKWKGKDTPKGVHFAPQYAVLIKMRSREHSQVDGDTYCTTLNKFRERFPDVVVRY